VNVALDQFFAISDLHLGHKRVLELDRRPFGSIEEHDFSLIRMWNAKVPPTGIVFVVGDFAFGDHTPLLTQLNGEKHLIPGNHDHRRYRNKAKGWASKDDLLKIIKVDGIEITLCHYGLRVWRNSHLGALHLYGHSHGSLPADDQSCDMGANLWDYAPAALPEIMARMKTHAPRFHGDHHQPKVA
jgi:calcineurin-like phosphoesterase family protein